MIPWGTNKAGILTPTQIKTARQEQNEIQLVLLTNDVINLWKTYFSNSIQRVKLFATYLLSYILINFYDYDFQLITTQTSISEEISTTKFRKVSLLRCISM